MGLGQSRRGHIQASKSAPRPAPPEASLVVLTRSLGDSVQADDHDGGDLEIDDDDHHHDGDDHDDDHDDNDYVRRW